MLRAIGSVRCISAIQTLVISEAAQARCINYSESRYCLFVFEHREFFTSHGGYLLNTTLVPGVGFSVAGLDRAQFGFNRFQSFLFIVVIVTSLSLKTVF